MCSLLQRVDFHLRDLISALVLIAAVLIVGLHKERNFLGLVICVGPHKLLAFLELFVVKYLCHFVKTSISWHSDARVLDFAIMVGASVFVNLERYEELVVLGNEIVTYAQNVDICFDASRHFSVEHFADEEIKNVLVLWHPDRNNIPFFFSRF